MITSQSNPAAKWVRRLQMSRKARERDRAFVIEGERLAYEAVGAREPVRLVLHSSHISPRGRGLVNSLARLGAEVKTVSDEVMRACSDLDTAPGILAVLPFPESSPPQSLTMAVVADGLADPGNMGTLLRTALAAGVEAVFLTPGTVDVYNPKVVRAAMGAHFCLPILSTGVEQIMGRLKDLQIRIAEARKGSPYHQVNWRLPSALVVGGEARGASKAMRELVEDYIHIPMPGKSESLNAAISAAVILFEAARQRGSE